MEEKPFMKIDTISKDLLKEAVRQNGRQPDNFVDSAEGTYPGIPDVDRDPAAQKLVDQIGAAADELVEQSRADVAKASGA